MPSVGSRYEPSLGRVLDVPMRENCKFFESRSYPNGETVRKCDLDLAPEAPWRCPEGCRAYQPRLADVNWQHGSLIIPPTPPEPESLGADPSIGALLDEAEEIVNAVAATTRAEVNAAQEGGRAGGSRAGDDTGNGPFWRRFFRRR